MLYSLLLPNKHERGAEEMHNQNSSLCLQLFEYANTEPSNTYIQAKRKKKRTNGVSIPLAHLSEILHIPQNMQTQ